MSQLASDSLVDKPRYGDKSEKFWMQAAPSAINSMWKLAFEKLIFSERWFEKCLVAMIKKDKEDWRVGNIFPFSICFALHFQSYIRSVNCNSVLLNFVLVLWLYLGNNKIYRRSADVKTTRFFRAFQLSAWVTVWSSHGLIGRRARRTIPRGPKGLQLEVRARRAPRLLVPNIFHKRNK